MASNAQSWGALNAVLSTAAMGLLGIIYADLKSDIDTASKLIFTMNAEVKVVQAANVQNDREINNLWTEINAVKLSQLNNYNSRDSRWNGSD